MGHQSRFPHLVFGILAIVGTSAGSSLWVATTPAMALAYDDYASGCDGCHGAFPDAPYRRMGVDQGWGASLHDVHRNRGTDSPAGMLQRDCDTCHFGRGRSPVYLNQSNGGTGLDPIACMGCHGRAEDNVMSNPNPDMQTSYGAGLRQHHYRAGQTVCVGCHADSNPMSWAPATEDTAPPYYFTPDSAHPSKPTDACSPGGEEDFGGSSIGLDNDGDGTYDTMDTDCAGGGGVCGNGMVEAGETCDPVASCPRRADCDDGDVCTADALAGSRTMCTASCVNTVIRRCFDGDGCCPAMCSAATDNDCGAIADGGVLDSGVADGGVADGGTTDAGPEVDAGATDDGGVPADAQPPGDAGAMADAQVVGDGAMGMPDGSLLPPPGEDGGCGCRLAVGRTRTPSWVALLAGLLLTMRRRRRGAPF